MSHHHHVVGNVLDDVQVVGHKQHPEAARVTQFLKQVEDGALHRHVQGCRRFVGQQHLRVAGQGECDHDALLLASAQFVRVFALRPLGQADFGKQARNLSQGRLAPHALVKLEWLGDLGPDPHRWVQGRHRVLENHGHVPADGRVVLARGRPKRPLRPANLARDELSRARKQPHDGQRGEGFARAGLAHDARRGPSPNVTRHPFHHRLAAVKGDLNVAKGKEGGRRHGPKDSFGDLDVSGGLKVRATLA